MKLVALLLSVVAASAAHSQSDTSNLTTDGDLLAVTSPSEEETSRREYQHLELDPNNPYSHWDSDSEEQEREMELQRLREPDETNITLQGDVPAASALAGRSYLLLLAGNSTIVKLRQRDFAKYLKLNLAARLSLEYDDVRVNRVVLAPPRLVVNVSVVTPSSASVARKEDSSNMLKEEAPLHMLAETNATLLELSGEEYHVVRLLPLRSNPASKDAEDYEDNSVQASTMMMSDRHSDIELVIYTAVGGACAVVIVATLLVALSKHTAWPWRRPPKTTWHAPPGRLRPHDFAAAANGPAPTVIYSGSFAAGASWVDGGGAITADDPVKLVANNPLFADLEMMGSNTPLGNNILAHQQRHSKLHIFSCRPGSLLIPMPPRRKPIDTHPLDVRIGEDNRRGGHDNPNYLT